MTILSSVESNFRNSEIAKKLSIQQQIFNELENALQPFIKTALTQKNWQQIIIKIQAIFQYFKQTQKILKVEEICNKYCSDFILEYDIDFSEGWFMYCHLRHQHLMIKFVPKEF